MKKFLMQIVVLSIIFGAFFYLGMNQGWTKVVHPLGWASLPILLPITIGAFYLLIRQKDPQYFTMFFLVTVVARMLLCAGILGIFIFNNLESPKLFILNFFIVYFSFTGFEIAALITNLRALSKRVEKEE